MKNNLFLFLAVLISFSMNAQNEGVKIKYTETMFLDAVIASVPPQFAANIPKSRDIKKTLTATPSASSYELNKEDKDPEPTEAQGGGGGRMRMMNRMLGSGNVVFSNFDESKNLVKTDLFGKDFIIEEEKDFAWKMHSGEQRDIIGYTCIKATTMDDTTLVTAWYAPKLPYSIGPDGYFGLPGTILALSVGENKVYLATSVVEKSPILVPITAPTKGDKVTRAEFKKISDEKIAEMRKNFGGGAGGTFRVGRQ
jgi:GLPGLI family protein